LLDSLLQEISFCDAELTFDWNGQSEDICAAAKITGEARNVFQQREHADTECRAWLRLKLCHTQLQHDTPPLLCSSSATIHCTPYLEERERHSGCSK